MGKNNLNKCRFCRREGMKLFLKGDRCHTAGKCPIEKRKLIKSKNMKMKDYGIQLREKQKIKRYYGMMENQFRNMYDKAARKDGITGDNLLILCERRLDNVVYRMKLAKSRAEARQLVNHGMFTINGKKIDIPSHLVRVNDEISLTSAGKRNKKLSETIEINQNELPDVEWLRFDFTQKKGSILKDPVRSDITMTFNEQLVVELYSK